MRFFKTGLAIVCGLMLTATGLWAAGASDSDDSAAATDKETVFDPATGHDVDRARVWRDTHVGT